jgi:glycosyltransferase involved in cell wall biosynthesis
VAEQTPANESAEIARPPAVRRLTLVISSLGSGGAERVMGLLAGHWAGQGLDVTLITLSSRSTDFFPLDERVQRIDLDLLKASAGPSDALHNNWNRFSSLRSAIRESKPDAVLSFTDATNVLVLLATRGLGVRVVVSERIDPRYHRIGRGWELLRKLTYRHADTLVVQTEAVRAWGEQMVRPGRVAVISNPVLVKPSHGEAPPNRSRTIAAMGRLDPQKGFDLLVQAFAQVAAGFPEWALVIYGEGAERGRLEHLVREYKLGNRVRFPGRTTKPHDELSQAQVFVLSSRYEGFPNALLEAMACGCAVVSFDCPSGPGELIQHGVNGILVPPGDVEALADALRKMCSHESFCRGLGAEATKVSERFSMERISDEWMRVLTG